MHCWYFFSEAFQWINEFLSSGVFVFWVILIVGARFCVENVVWSSRWDFVIPSLPFLQFLMWVFWDFWGFLTGKIFLWKFWSFCVCKFSFSVSSMQFNKWSLFSQQFRVDSNLVMNIVAIHWHILIWVQITGILVFPRRVLWQCWGREPGHSRKINKRVSWQCLILVLSHISNLIITWGTVTKLTPFSLSLACLLG